METAKVYVWKDEESRKWNVGTIIPLTDGEQMVIVKHTADSHAAAFQWIENSYVSVEVP